MEVKPYVAGLISQKKKEIGCLKSYVTPIYHIHESIQLLDSHDIPQDTQTHSKFLG